MSKILWNLVLRLDPKDADARQTKLFLLLQTEQYSAALSLIDSDDDHAHHAYERAYSLYRLSHESEARDVLKSIKADQNTENSRGLVHLEAQLACRSHRGYVGRMLMFLFVRLIAKDHTMSHLICTTNCSILPNRWVAITHIYACLIVFKDSEEQSDILTNLQASQSHLDFINTGFLRALDSLPSSITSTLETAPPPHLLSMAVPQTSDSTTVNASTGLNSRPVPKKVRMSRVPAGVIPGVTPAPDPERWLKKSERSTYGQGKKRKGPGGGGATQGSASVDSPVTTISHPSKTGGGKGKKKR